MFDDETPSSCRHNSWFIHGLPKSYTIYATYRNPNKTCPWPSWSQVVRKQSTLIMRPKYRSHPRSNDHNAASYDIRISLIIYTISITCKLNYLAHNIHIPQAFFPFREDPRLVSWLMCGMGALLTGKFSIRNYWTWLGVRWLTWRPLSPFTAQWMV